MKNKAILKEYIVTYKCSTSKSGESQTDSWRKKYLGLIGVLYIIKSVHKQYFQWNPTKETTVYDFEGIFDGFCVEVDVGDEITDIYLYHKKNSVKMFMFAINTKDELEIRDIIAANIETYINIYTIEYIEN